MLNGGMVRTIDITRPFIAIRRDVEGYFERTMGEYLCNPLDEDLFDAEVDVGDFSSDVDLGVFESVLKKPNLVTTVSAGQAVRFELSTQDEYDEMVCHWSVRYRTKTDGLTTVSFGTFTFKRSRQGGASD